jgi:GABA permease
MARNPLRSEAEAFRFLLVTIGAFAAIAIGSLIHTWLGIAAWILATIAVVQLYFRRPEPPPPVERQHVEHVGPEDERRILVIANQTVGGPDLLDLLRSRAEGVREEILVVAPALNDRLRTWTSDEDPARKEAQRRLDATLERLAAEGIRARGEIGDSDPLQAIEDALRTFGADEIVISTLPPEQSNWLAQDVVERARARWDVPVTHVVGGVGGGPPG